MYVQTIPLTTRKRSVTTTTTLSARGGHVFCALSTHRQRRARTSIIVFYRDDTETYDLLKNGATENRASTLPISVSNTIGGRRIHLPAESRLFSTNCRVHPPGRGRSDVRRTRCDDNNQRSNDRRRPNDVTRGRPSL